MGKQRTIEEEPKLVDNPGLEDFTWDDDLTFFNTDEIPIDETDDDLEEEEPFKEEKKPKEDIEEEDGKKTKSKVDKLEDEDKDEEVEPEKKKPEEEPEPFADDVVIDDEDIVPTKSKEFFKVLAGELKETGVFANVTIDEDEEITEERFVELQDEEIESRVTETFESFFDELDEDGRQFLKFKKNGGDTREFLNLLKQEADTPTGDIDDEAYQKKFLKHYYEVYEGMDLEDIDDHIDLLEDRGRMGKYAKRSYQKVENLKKEARKEAQQNREEAIKLKDKGREEYQAKLKKTLETAENIGAFPVTTKDKRELHSYITKPVQKVGKNVYITQFQADMNAVGKDFEKLILMAKLVKQDFDISDIEKKVETKKVSKIKERLSKQRGNRRPGAAGGGKGKTLSDFFDN